MYDKVHWYVIYKKKFSSASKNHKKFDLDKHIFYVVLDYKLI